MTDEGLVLQPQLSKRMVEILRPVAGQGGAPHHAIMEYPAMGTPPVLLLPIA